MIYTAHDDNRKPKEAGEDFRDPKVWKHEDTWYMIIGTGKHGRAKAVLYDSKDLRIWNYLGVVCESNELHYDKFLVEENNSGYLTALKGDSVEIITKIKFSDEKCKNFVINIRKQYEIIRKQLRRVFRYHK